MIGRFVSKVDGKWDRLALIPVLLATAAAVATAAALTACQPRASARPEVEPEVSAARAPADDFGCGLPPELKARGWPSMLQPLEPGPPPKPSPGGFSLVVLPDTQYYVACRSPHLERQVRYVLEQQQDQNIVLVLTVGDLTEHNEDAEWAFFHEAVSPLFERVPLLLTTGNHDHGSGGAARTRGTSLTRIFGQPPARARALLAKAPSDGNWENAYYRLPVGKGTLGVLTLEWGPRQSIVEWANGVLDQYATDRQIFTTHAYLYHDDTRYDWASFGPAQEWNPRSYGTARLDPEQAPGPGNWSADASHDGEMLWQHLLKSRPGLFLTVNGHVLVDGQGYLESRGVERNVVHQMLVNFQMLKDGGSGFLRLLQVEPGGKKLRVLTYSPSLDVRATGPGEQRELTIDPPLDF